MPKQTEALKTEKTLISQISQARDLSHGFLAEAMAARGLKGLVPSHGELLLALHLNDAMSMQELAAWVQRSKPTVTVLVDKLIAQKIVRKRRCPEDGRRFEVSLTAKGQRLISTLGDISSEMHSKIDSILSSQEKQQLSKLLSKLTGDWYN